MFSGKKKVSTGEIPRPSIRRPASNPTSTESAEPPRFGQESKFSRGSDSLGGKSSKLNTHLSFHGDLRFSGSLLVDCEVQGSIVTEDTLTIGSSGRVEAEISAGVVEISGKITGNIKARDSVKILAGGEVHGNIETPSISMEQGVIFEGNCTRPASAQSEEAEEKSSSERESSERGSSERENSLFPHRDNPQRLTTAATSTSSSTNL